MSIFSENIWEADAVGDKLSKQLFRKVILLLYLVYQLMFCF